jgi:CysZ protein
MLDAAIKALVQMSTPPFRSILLRSVGLAVIFLIALGVGVYEALAWLTGAGETWAEGTLGTNAHWPILVLAKLLAIAFSLGIVVGGVFLMPAVTALVASFFGDEIAEHVEREHYPLDPPGVAPPLGRAVLEGVKTASLAVLVYLCCTPLLWFVGFGAILFFLATAWLLGREYFELAAMRFHPVTEAKALRRLHGGSVFAAGLFIAGFVSVPIVNLATPLFGTAFMVHMHKRLVGRGRRELLEPVRGA